jgi:hypothetical protein
MLRSLLLLLLGAFLVSGAVTPAVPRKCGSEVTPAAAAKVEVELAKYVKVAAANTTNDNAQRVPAVIPVYFHVITQGKSIADGNIP